jgi:hypothetical protein
MAAEDITTEKDTSAHCMYYITCQSLDQKISLAEGDILEA